VSAHTPGPWTFKKSGSQEWQIDAPNGDPTLGYVDWECMALCYGSDDSPEHGKTVGEANARLIAAAPAMLEALERISELSKSQFYKPQDLGMAAIHLAKAAIAKATGEAP
jgi:hypothetical protein